MNWPVRQYGVGKDCQPGPPCDTNSQRWEPKGPKRFWTHAAPCLLLFGLLPCPSGAWTAHSGGLAGRRRVCYVPVWLVQMQQTVRGGPEHPKRPRVSCSLRPFVLLLTWSLGLIASVSVRAAPAMVRLPCYWRSPRGTRLGCRSSVARRLREYLLRHDCSRYERWMG